MWETYDNQKPTKQLLNNPFGSFTSEFSSAYVFTYEFSVPCCLDNRVDKIITSDGGLYAKYAKLLQIVLIPNPK
ncbi:MAG: hypothetical protein H7230_02020 [Candidatus Parcubacteria bacterium]|nr:hypothetical protein [Candidatus Paceibacterota bacterium]